MIPRAQHLLSIAVTLAIVHLAGDTQAQTIEVSCETVVPVEVRRNPDELALRGVRCFEAKEYSMALKHYRAAYRRSKTPLLFAAMGRSLHELGIFSLARGYYTSYLNASKDPEGKTKINERLADLEIQEAESATLRIEAMPVDATIELILPSGHLEQLGTTPAQLTLRAGSYRVVINRPGFLTYDRTIELAPRTSETVAAELLRNDALLNVGPRAWRRAGTYVMIGSTPLLITSGIFWALCVNTSNEADDLSMSDPDRTSELRDSALVQRQFATIAGITGVSLMAVGVIFYLIGNNVARDTAPRASDTTERASRWQISPTGFSVRW